MKDEPLVQQIKSGDPRALGTFYEEHRQEFVHWIIKEFNCPMDDGKDIYQMAVLAVYQNIQQGKLTELRSSLKTYLFGVGKNLGHEWTRQSERKQPLDNSIFIQGLIEEDGEEEMANEKLELVRTSLHKLGEPCRQLLEFFYYARKSMEEITVLLAYKNADTAKNQKYKCMGRLRKIYEEEFHKQLT